MPISPAYGRPPVFVPEKCSSDKAVVADDTSTAHSDDSITSKSQTFWRFQGSYKLITYTSQVDGEEAQPAYGQEWIGRIMYCGDFMSAVISTKELVPYANPVQPKDGWMVGSPEETYQNAKKVISYSGPFKVDEGNKTVTHCVDVAVTPPNSSIFAGLFQLRKYDFSDDDFVLHLSAVTSAPDGTKTTHRLVWHRESSDVCNEV